MTTLLFDIETNAGDFRDLSGFDRVHCMSYIVDGHKENVKRVVGTDKVYDLWRKLVAYTKRNEVTLIGHNIVSFDLPVLYEVFRQYKDKEFLQDFRALFLLPRRDNRVTILDTVLMAKLAYPDLYATSEKNPAFRCLSPKNWASHSLKNWGRRLGVHKGSFHETTDWENYTEEMGDYCDLDTVVTHELLHYLPTSPFTRWVLSGEGRDVTLRETRFAQLIRQQELHGVSFDEDGARRLQAAIQKEIEGIEKELSVVFPPEVVETKTPEYWELTNLPTGETIRAETKGACQAIRKTRGWRPKDTRFCRGPNRTKSLPFNPGSRQQIVTRLKEIYGWEPEEFTEPSDRYPEGQPKVDGEVLEALPYKEAQVLARYLDLKKIYGYLVGTDNSWCSNVLRGRIHGKVNTLGANTSRCTHSAPNLAQVPSSRKPYGHECRSLFRASPGYVFIGWDASGLELRCLAGYLANYDGGRYAKMVTEGDIHTENQQAAGLPTRDNAKTFIYGYLYGAGAAKIGQIVGGTARDGQLLKDRFAKKTLGLDRLQEAIKNALSTRGYLLGLDRRRMYPRSEHSALNLVLQGCGAIVMKEALIQQYFYLEDHGVTLGKDYHLLLNVHDEVQCEALPGSVDVVLASGPEAIRRAGQVLKLKCPLDGEAKEGETWADTH